MELTGSWRRLDHRIARWSRPELAANWNADAPFALLAADAKSALQEASSQGVIDGNGLINLGNAVMRREFSVFGVPLPKSGPWPWHKDWRFDQEWVPAYFRSYVHDAPRSQPYDVKFPWELSRLTFLPMLVQADMLEGGNCRTEQAFRILTDWRDSNPLAYSVNWYPMEAAMRGIELCLFSDMARQGGIGSDEASLLMQLLAQHGEFVMRTIEFTDNAANHYIAELVALLLIGRTLHGWYRPAQRWYRFAEQRIAPEVTRQFLPDGVNFEKSTAYHRLVQDLFMLGSAALRHEGKGLNRERRARLHAATRYNAAFLRPDNRCPLIGDSDDAVVFAGDDAPVRDHRPSLAVAALAFRDSELKAAAGALPPAGLWLFGRQALTDWPEMSATPEPFYGHHHFEHGGMVVARSERHYLIMDIGEVGQNGLGGHGHNDLLSFELMFNGSPLIIDPGSYIYSGDFAAHDRFRSTRAHNGLVVDDREIAPFTGKFRIANRAQPIGISVEDRNARVSVIRAGHTGYQVLPDPVTHERTLQFDRYTGSLQCRDRLLAGDNHHAVRRLYFAPGVEPAFNNDGLRVEVDGESILIRWDGQSRGRLLDTHVSPCYGRLEPSRVLEIETDTSKEATLSLDIYSESHGPLPAEGAVQ